MWWYLVAVMTKLLFSAHWDHYRFLFRVNLAITTVAVVTVIANSKKQLSPEEVRAPHGPVMPAPTSDCLGKSYYNFHHLPHLPFTGTLPDFSSLPHHTLFESPKAPPCLTTRSSICLFYPPNMCHAASRMFQALYGAFAYVLNCIICCYFTGSRFRGGGNDGIGGCILCSFPASALRMLFGNRVHRWCYLHFMTNQFSIGETELTNLKGMGAGIK